MDKWRIRKPKRADGLYAGWWNIERFDPLDGAFYVVVTIETGAKAIALFQTGHSAHAKLIWNP